MITLIAMSALLADIDWESVIKTAIGALITAGGSAGIIAKFFWKQWCDEKEKQRDHERDMQTRFENITKDMQTRFETTAQKFAETTVAIQKEAAADNRETVKTLLSIQREAVNAVNELAVKVNDLGNAINHMGYITDRTEKTEGEDSGVHMKPNRGRGAK